VSATGQAGSGQPESRGTPRTAITETRHGNASIVQITGDIDANSARQLTETVAILAAVPPQADLDTVIIDFSQVSALAAAGSSALNASAQACRGRLAVRVVATGLILRSIQLTGLDHLAVHPCLEDALAASRASRPGDLACTLSAWPTHVLITVDGECDITTAPQLHDALLSPQSRRAPRVIVSLAGLSFLDSTGVYTLLSARSALAHDGAELVLAAPRPSVSRVLALVGANRLLDVYPTLAQAIPGG